VSKPRPPGDKPSAQRREHARTAPRPLRLQAKLNREAAELALLEWIPDGVMVTDGRGLIVFANRPAEQMTGYRRHELAGHTIELLVPKQLRAIHRQHRHDYSSGRGGDRPMGRADYDFRVRRKDGTEFFADIALGSIDTEEGRQTIAVIRDITERRRLEYALEHQALHDPLTGLANRTLFFDRLNQALLSARRERKEVALAMLDLDSFKDVNDAFGHAAGDDLLKQVAVRLGTGLRATDTAARLGGDEFAWILPRVAGRQAVERMARRRLRELQKPFAIDKRSVELGVSAGIALYPDDGRDADALMRHADSAMYAAKREGRGVAFYPSRKRHDA
jgi:diguanylate cyclase (GGDEF)-like protein/PAS domain S-box-containing protein